MLCGMHAIGMMPSLLSVICRRSGCGSSLQSIMKRKAFWPSLQMRCQEASARGRSPASCASWASSRGLAASIRARRGRRRCCTSHPSKSSLVGSCHLMLLTVHSVAWSMCCPCFFVKAIWLRRVHWARGNICNLAVHAMMQQSI